MKTWVKWLAAGLCLALVVAVVFFTAQTTPIVKKKTITLTVVAQEGSFNIITPDAIQIKAGENGAFTVDVEPLQGFSKTVKFTLTGGPTGMTVAWTDNDDTWEPGHPEGWNLQCNLTIPLDNGLVGAYPVELTGTAQ